jgi:two-component system NtrC family sensor kinase
LKDQSKTKQGLIQEITSLRQRIAELEQSESEPKRVEEALQYARNMLQTVLDSIPSSVFWKDRNSIYLGGNRTWLEAVGLKSSEEIAGKSDYDLPWGNKQADSFREYDRRVIESGIPEYDITEPYLRVDGTHAWAKTNKVPLRDTEGNVVGVLGTYEDITERRHAEEALKASEHKYRILLENASDPILLADMQGNIVEANRKAEELWGHMKEELLQMHYTQLHPMPELERTIAAFKKIMEKNTGHLSSGFIQRKDGDIVPVDITCNVIEYAGRKVVQGSFRDISEHKQAKDQLEKIVKERTAELSRNNEQLKVEIKERKRAEAAMRRKGRELQLHSKKLEELNTALKVLLKQREQDRKELEDKVVSNVKELLLPHVEEMKKRKIDCSF